MKTKLFFSAALLVVATSVAYYGCKKKDDAGSGGSGTSTTSTNADYVGTWNVNETCTSPWSYVMTAAASGSNGVVFTNFHKGTQPGGFTISGTVSGNSLTIPVQVSTSPAQGGPYTFSGSGTLTPPSTLAITYTMSGMGCTSNCTK